MKSKEIERNMVSNWFKNNGFKVLNTGGNCTAMVRNFSDNVYILITLEDDNSIPVYETDRITVGVYTENSDFLYSSNTFLDSFMGSFIH